MWRHWNPYYHPDPPKWLFLIIFGGPLLTLFLLGYFVLSFRVVEQISVNTTLSQVLPNLTETLENSDFAPTDYDAIYQLLMKYENIIANMTTIHFNGYGSNAFLTANLFFGGAEFNKTGGTGVLVFLELALCFLVIFVVTYLVYDLLYPKPFTPRYDRVLYPELHINSEEEEHLFRVAVMIEKCKKNGTYEKERRQLENIFADTTYQDQVDMLRESDGEEDEETEKRVPPLWERIPGLRPPNSPHVTTAIYFFAVAISPVLFIVCLLISAAYPPPDGGTPILSMARRSFGIDLKLELVYTVGNWFYSLAVTAMAIAFHGVTLACARMVHWLVFQ